jgi:anti-sigma factor RsiW
MKQGDTPLDQETLAAYISNTLPPEERAAVTRALVRDPESRELLAMAAQAIGEERKRLYDRLHDRLRLDSRDRRAEKNAPSLAKESGRTSPLRRR